MPEETELERRKKKAMYRNTTGQRQNDNYYQYYKQFIPLPWQIEPWRDKSPVMLLTGAAGGGKSVLAAEKVHAYCLKYPGSTALVLRKSRSFMTNSTLLVLQRFVIGKDPRVRHVPSQYRFEYENGSILAYGGMQDSNQREAIRSIGQSGGIDIAWLEEATQFEEEDFNEVLARMRGTAANWRQVILTTNPDSPAHWINVRLRLGNEAKVYYSAAKDNPHNPESYRKSLEKLTGIQYERLVRGLWVKGSGIIYDTWDDTFTGDDADGVSGNVMLAADYKPGQGEVIWALDDGYSGKQDQHTGMFSARSHPRAILFIQLRPDGRMAVFDELYKVNTLSADQIEEALAISLRKNYPRPTMAIRDRAAASLGGALEDAGISVVYNTLDVEEGIKETREWISPDANGVRLVIVHPRCRVLRYEMASYVRSIDGKPVKEHDHGPDALRYAVWQQAYGKRTTIDIVTFDETLSTHRGSYAQR